MVLVCNQLIVVGREDQDRILVAVRKEVIKAVLPLISFEKPPRIPM
jgi:hypothetical protein